MSKLVFHYASMNAGKTTRLLQVAHSFTSSGKKVVCLLPDIETRFGEAKGVIKSRLNIETPATVIYKNDNILDLIEDWESYDLVLIDEVQFLTKEQVEQISDIVDNHGVTVLAYGLRVDFMGNLFEGTKAMFEIADKFEEIQGVCSHASCSRSSSHNLRVDSNGIVVKDGQQVSIGAESSYHAVCRGHYKKSDY
jgi:thymidine kinase